MTFDVTIRHSTRRGTEITHEHREIEASDEAALLETMRFDGALDGVAAIRPLDGGRLMPFSVDTGQNAFPSAHARPTDAHRAEARPDAEGRQG